MNVFALTRESTQAYKITVKNFEEMTGKQSRWYRNRNGKNVQFAVCPMCKNPIRIVALYERNDNSPKPYGKHCKYSVTQLANYDQEAYDRCLYANPNLTLNKKMKRGENNKKSLEILDILKKEFDKIIYIVQSFTGIYIKEALAREMLESFLSMEGHRYIGTHTYNLPWMFAYMTTSHNLWGRFLLNIDDEIAQVLSKHNDIRIENKQILSSGKKFISINFCFMHHKLEKMEEVIKLVVNVDNKEIFTKIIAIDAQLFTDFLNNPPKSYKYNERIHDIAKELLP